MAGTVKRTKGKALPVSAHRAFPAVVALWFAALLGLGSLIVPVILFERLVDLVGISSIIAAAAPPLGVTARLGIALVAALSGAAVGLFLARRIAASHQVEFAPAPHQTLAADSQIDEDDEGDETPARRPISAHEELGSESLDAPLAAEPMAEPRSSAGRRRTFAVSDDRGPDEFFDHAPLPGGAIELEHFATDPVDKDPNDPAGEIMDLTDEAEITQPQATPLAFPAPDSEPSDPEPDGAERVAPIDTHGDAPLAARTPSAPLSERPLGELGLAELVERFALALQNYPAGTARPQAAWDNAEADAGPLVFRRSGPVALAADPAHELADIETPPIAPAAPISRPFAVPQGFNPFAQGDDWEFAPERSGFSSLLDMKTGHAPAANTEPHRRPFDPPGGAASRPASMPASADTERALREALEKLQRISGAA